ncbi:hypothetical protein COT48_01010 [Candidatus Woesearchaeota archaeon CG08_land_8_20_14_0_20_47_9]|nr:MAG: hypothetical protein AUJ69_01050 [Candidatus Woesearchaeota archaeon CG1_02_47_18]PIO04327.1 MAG: hypothetical protein COT48_01010 [Candidatus Woesearchaeota archaeon CG08_land_8_20_14_0_20_47_9]HII29483.1 hypothetical protein [Candidatus Woesearchaeota archaeon]
MTYSWAILIVLGVIGALSYFGLLNPSSLIPERCLIQGDLVCKDFKVIDASDDSVMLRLENGLGRGIMITSINISSDSISCVRSYATGLNIPNGEVTEITISGPVGNCPTNCCTIDYYTGKKKAYIIVTYYNEGASPSFSHRIVGELFAESQKIAS